MIQCDSIPMMNQLCRMAGIGDAALISKIVLVLSVDELPQMYVRSFLNEGELVDTPINVSVLPEKTECSICYDPACDTPNGKH